jgi:hypothetical protein
MFIKFKFTGQKPNCSLRKRYIICITQNELNLPAFAFHFTSIYLWLYSPCGPSPLFSFLIYTQSVGLLGRVTSPSQGRYLHTGQHEQRINAHNTDIHALNGIRTHDPSVRAGEDGSCRRPRGHCDRLASERRKTVHASDFAATVTG